MTQATQRSSRVICSSRRRQRPDSNQAGDVASAIGLAYEMGHNRQAGSGGSTPQTNAGFVNPEDRADCFSGAWCRYEIAGGALQAEDFPSAARYLKPIASADNDPHRDHGDLELWQQHTPRVGVIQNGRHFGHNRPLDRMSEY